MRRTHAIYATLRIQGKLSAVLLDSDSCVSPISWIFLQSLGFSGALKDYKVEIHAANSTSRSVKGKPELFLYLEKLVSGFGHVFLVMTVRNFHCLLGLNILTEVGSILYAKQEKNSFLEKDAERRDFTQDQLPTSQRV